MPNYIVGDGGDNVLVGGEGDDVIVGDPLLSEPVVRISTDSFGQQGNGISFNAVFSPDGTRVAFASIADNLIAGDTDHTWDVFIRDLATGEVTRVSTTSSGDQ